MRETLPDGRVRITLAQPIPQHAEPVMSFTIRPFTLGERLTHGDPLEFVTQGDGQDLTTMPVVNRAVLLAYARLLIEGIDLDVLMREGGPQGMMLADMIEASLLGFFTKARSWSSAKPAPSSAQASLSPTSPA